MLRLIGASCVAASVMLAGRKRVRTVRAEASRVRALRDGVSALRTLVLFRRLRLGDCFAELSQDRLFFVLSRSVEERPGENLTVLFSEALEAENEIPERAKKPLLSLAPALESADTAAQEQSFSQTAAELTALLSELEQTLCVRCREITVLSVCTALVLAILLL